MMMMLVLSGNKWWTNVLDSSRTLAWLANASIELEKNTRNITQEWVSTDCDINAAMRYDEVEAKWRIYFDFDFSSKREMRSCTLIVRSDSILAKQSLNSFLVSFAVFLISSLISFLRVSIHTPTPSAESTVVLPNAKISLGDAAKNGCSIDITGFPVATVVMCLWGRLHLLKSAIIVVMFLWGYIIVMFS